MTSPKSKEKIMDKVKPNSEPETLDAPSTFGGRRPSPGSPDDDLLGLVFQPFWWVGLTMGVISGIIGVWSPLCFIGGIFVGAAIAKCAMQANGENAEVRHGAKDAELD